MWSRFEHVLLGMMLNVSFCFLSYPMGPSIMFTLTEVIDPQRSYCPFDAKLNNTSNLSYLCFLGWIPGTKKVRGKLHNGPAQPKLRLLRTRVEMGLLCCSPLTPSLANS